MHRVAAPRPYGCSPKPLRLQPRLPTVAGKPTAATYRFVEERLRSLAPEDGVPPSAATQWCFYMARDATLERTQPRPPAQPRAAPRSPAQPRAAPRSPAQPRAAP